MNRLVLLVFALVPVAAWSQAYVVPRDEFGYPDLNGVWNFNDSTPFERPERFGDWEFLTDAEIVQKFTRLETGEARREQNERSVSQRVLEVPTDDTKTLTQRWPASTVDEGPRYSFPSN